MVIPLANLQRLKMDHHSRGLIVELVGPAGAGKSTLFRTLQEDTPWIHGGFNPPIWDISSSPFYVKNIFSLLTMLYRIHEKSDKRITRRQLACLALLNGWYDLLRKKADRNSDVILLDQGPVFLIAYLKMFGPERLYQPKLQDWWDRVYEQWYRNLDLIVYVDAANDVLLNRIRNRNVDLLQGMSDQDANIFLSDYRAIYEQVIGRFTSLGNLTRLARIDSSLHSVNEISARVISEIETCERQVLNLITTYSVEME